MFNSTSQPVLVIGFRSETSLSNKKTEEKRLNMKTEDQLRILKNKSENNGSLIILVFIETENKANSPTPIELWLCIIYTTLFIISKSSRYCAHRRA